MKRFFILILISAVLFNCSGSKQTEIATEEDLETPPSGAYCLWHNISLREGPSEKDKWLTSVSFGEHLIFRDSVKVDESTDKKFQYSFVELSDGTKGWIRADFITIDAELATITENTTLYKRPDLLTGTDKKFSPMDVVAVTEKKDDWLEIKGKRKKDSWFITGWIPSSSVSWRPADVTDAILISRAMEIDDANERIKSLKNVLSNNQESIFKGMIDQYLFDDPENLLKEEYHNLFSCWVDEISNDTMEEGPSVLLNGQDINQIYFGIFFKAQVLLDCAILNKNPDGDSWNWEINQSILRQYTGVDPLIDGPHLSEAPFNNYNPKVIQWAQKNLIPHPSQNFLGSSFQEVYNVLLKDDFQSMTLARIELYNSNVENLLSGYKAEVIEEEMDGVEWLYNHFESYPWEKGFWLRRKIDNTENEMWQSLVKIMMLYDKEWFLKQDNSYAL